MLKVVGASWYQTKISSMIVFSAFLLAIGALFILNIERPLFDHVYCSTAYWTNAAGFRLEFWGQGNKIVDIPKGAARICYKDGIQLDEWPHMEIESNAHYPDRVQAFAAGALEGALTWKTIYNHWAESIDTPCKRDEETAALCMWLRQTVNTNYNNLKSQFEVRLNNPNDHYWYQVYLFYQQLEGMEFGWRVGIKRSAYKRSGLEIPFVDFLIMNLATDITDLQFYYNKVVRRNDEGAVDVFIRPQMNNTPHILLNVSEDTDQIQVTLEHVAPQKASPLTRILKKYKLNYHLSSAFKSKANHIVPGNSIVFTGYAGLVSSHDEFYTITGRQSKITVAGTDLKYRPIIEMIEFMDLENSVFMSARVMTANRLATSATAWTKIMKRTPSTGGKQWLVIDRKLLRKLSQLDFEDHHHINDVTGSGASSSSSVIAVDSVEGDDNLAGNEAKSGEAVSILTRLRGLLWIVEQIPGHLQGEDVTRKVLTWGKLELTGVPFFDEIARLSGRDEQAEEGDSAAISAVKMQTRSVQDMAAENVDIIQIFVTAKMQHDFSEGLILKRHEPVQQPSKIAVLSQATSDDDHLGAGLDQELLANNNHPQWI